MRGLLYISNAEVLLFISCGDRLELINHIPDIEANYQGLKKLAGHLRTGGWFLLNIQKLFSSDVIKTFKGE